MQAKQIHPMHLAFTPCIKPCNPRIEQVCNLQAMQLTMVQLPGNGADGSSGLMKGKGRRRGNTLVRDNRLSLLQAQHLKVRPAAQATLGMLQMVGFWLVVSPAAGSLMQATSLLYMSWLIYRPCLQEASAAACCAVCFKDRNVLCM